MTIKSKRPFEHFQRVVDMKHEASVRDHSSQSRGALRKGLLLLSAAVVACLALFVTACSSISCPVQNKVATVYEVNGTLNDTLTITTRKKDGRDTILLNSSTNVTSFQLPLSFQKPVDVFLVRTTKLPALDTVWVEKDDTPHFESVDCGVTYFHTLLSVRHTGMGIDSIVILKNNVDYDLSAPHFRIYFTARN